MGLRVTVHEPTAADAEELVSAVHASRELHAAWVSAPATFEGYATHLARCRGDAFAGHLLRDRADGALVGVVDLSRITRGSLQSADVGYYGLVGGTGRGLLTEGVGLVVARAFAVVGLHRVEASIQPSNGRSLALIRGLGFRREGHSPRALHVAGAWRDHERWALLADEPAAAALVSRLRRAG